MDTIKSIIELFSYIAVICGVGILWYIKKQLNFDVMTSCMTRFQELLKENEKINLKVYLDLCNEQLFYIQHDYLKKQICIEWLDGMADYLPHISKDNNSENLNTNPQCLFKNSDLNNVKGYDRIFKSFTFNTENYNNIAFNKEDDFELRKHKRKQMIDDILNRLQKYKY